MPPPRVASSATIARVRAAAVLVVLAGVAHAADMPVTLVSDEEAEPIHSAILRGEAWTQDSARRLRAEAERRLKDGPWTVTFDRPKGLDLDPHEYYSESPFWWPDPGHPARPYMRREGQPNPDRFTANRTALNAMCDAVFTLGTAAFLLDDMRYAQRAARVIQVWFVNPKTRMNPGMEHAQSIPGTPGAPPATAIPDGRPFIRAIQGMEFLAQTGAWDARDNAAVRKWFEEYLRWLAQTGQDRRGADRAWWLAEEAAVASFLEDAAAERRAFAYYRDRLLPREIRAESVADLEPTALLCRIAQTRGVDLWSAQSKSGATVAALFDPKKAGAESGNVYYLAFVGMGLNKPDYIILYHRLTRPDSAWLALVDLLVGRWEAAAHQTRH